MKTTSNQGKAPAQLQHVQIQIKAATHEMQDVTNALQQIATLKPETIKFLGEMASRPGVDNKIASKKMLIRTAL